IGGAMRSNSHRVIISVLAAIMSLTTLFSARGLSRPRRIIITGWVSDSGCGAKHTKPGGADCVKKCLRGGAAGGQPEWKPQKMVVVDDTNRSIWTVENPEALRGNEGRHVTLNAYAKATKRKLRVSQVESVIE